jgi:hypothetical protein
MSSARSQMLIHMCLAGLLLSACCTAVAFATDTDAWLMHLINTVSARIPPTDNLAGVMAYHAEGLTPMGDRGWYFGNGRLEQQPSSSYGREIYLRRML